MRERIAGDFSIELTPMMSGPERWTVFQYTGRFDKALYSYPTRGQAVRAAKREWAAALRYNEYRR